MTSILSSISGYFSKSLMLGTFLPTVIHVVLGIIFIGPLLPEAAGILVPLAAFDTQWKIVAVSFITIVLSGLLYNLNIPVIRIYEGYPWQEWRIGLARARKYRSEFADLTRRASHLAELSDMFDPDPGADAPKQPDASAVFGELVKLAPDLQKSNQPGGVAGATDRRAEIYNRLRDEWNFIKRRLNDEFPGHPSLILPTRLGNVIRSFEYYPDKEYGMDAIVLWPRLVGVIDKEYAVSVDDAKTSFDFMLNSSVLSGLTALAILAAGLANIPALLTDVGLVQWAVEMLLFILLSFWFYRLSMRSAASWGGMVKGAFDLYRNKLLEALGYGRKPGTREEERTLWDGISLQMLLGNSRSGTRARDYIPSPSPPLAASCSPSGVPLELTRGSKRGPKWGGESVVVRVKNVDKDERSAENVVITVTLPPEHNFDWGSAFVAGQEVPITGTNPYRFSLGDIKAGESAELTNSVILRKVATPASL